MLKLYWQSLLDRLKDFRGAASRWRGLIHQHPLLAGGGAAGLLALAGLIALVATRPAAEVELVEQRAYFFDLNTGRVFAAGAEQIAPIPGPTGDQPNHQPAGVRAFVFSCGACKESDWKVGYIEMYTAEAKAAAERAQPAKSEPVMDPAEAFLRRVTATPGRLVRVVEASEWVEAATPEGEVIIRQAGGTCPGGRPPIQCLP